MTGFWTAKLVVPAAKSWIHFVAVQHPGAVAFVVMDVFIFIGVFSLLTVQVSQVSYLKYFFSLFIDVCYCLPTDLCVCGD